MMLLRVFALKAAIGSAFLNTRYADPNPKRSFKISAKYGAIGSLGGRTKSRIGGISLASSSRFLRPQQTWSRSSMRKPLTRVSSSSNEVRTDLSSSGLNGVPARRKSCLSVITGYSLTKFRKYSRRSSTRSTFFSILTVLNPPR